MVKPTLVYALLASAAYAAPQGTPDQPASAPAGTSLASTIAGLLSGLLGGQAGAQPGGQINTPEALSSPGTGKYGSVSKPLSPKIISELCRDEA
jgi:hypothetical protein